MARFHKEITIPCLVLVLGLMAGFTLLGGCSAHSHKVASAQKVDPSLSRCKTVGKKIGKHVTVLIRKDCLRAGKSEVVVWFHTLKSTMTQEQAVEEVKLGTVEATEAMISILGFKPALALLPVPKVKGYFCYTFLVTGVAEQ